MTEPSLDDMIRSIEWERPDVDVLEHLTDAVMAAARLDEIADDLVGHFVEQARSAGATWAEIGQSMGTTRQAAQKRFVHRGSKHRRGGLFFTRFDGNARRLVWASEDIARRSGSDHVGTHHMLLSLTDDLDGVTANGLQALGVSVEEVRRKAQLHDEAGGQPQTGHIRFGKETKKVLELSLREAIRSDDRQITEEHILLALTRDERSVAGSILSSCGLRRRALQGYLDRVSV
jgi:hypothetical protein